MFDSMKAKAAQTKLAMALAKEKIEIETGNGAVRLVINGAMQVQQVKIDPEKIDIDNLPQLEKWIESAFNQAMRRSMEVMAEKASQGGFDLPGMGS